MHSHCFYSIGHTLSIFLLLLFYWQLGTARQEQAAMQASQQRLEAEVASLTAELAQGEHSERDDDFGEVRVMGPFALLLF
jgi:cytochrome oxidase assembly protein ShyY1